MPLTDQFTARFTKMRYVQRYRCSLEKRNQRYKLLEIDDLDREDRIPVALISEAFGLDALDEKDWEFWTHWLNATGEVRERQWVDAVIASADFAKKYLTLQFTSPPQLRPTLRPGAHVALRLGSRNPDQPVSKIIEAGVIESIQTVLPRRRRKERIAHG